MSGSQAITNIRLRVYENGYAPIPVTAPDYVHDRVKSPGKQPFFKGWNNISLETISPEIIRSWPSHISNHPNTGLVCGRLIGLDIDVPVQPMSDQIQAMARAMLGHTPLRRVGKAPKALFCYQVPEPIAKMETPELYLPDGTKVQIEALAKGQQFVAYGIHPDTGQEYEWPESGPDAVRLEDLPRIAPEALKAFLAAAEAVFRSAGGRTKQEIEGETEPKEERRPPPNAGSTFGRATGAAGKGDFFKEVNARALADIEPWFRHLFPRAYWQPNGSSPPGAWRVSSADLDRGLEEDLSMHQTEGGYDFGTREPMTPISTVIRWGGAKDAVDAAMYLCDKLRLDPASLGWRAARQAGDARQGGDDQSTRFDVPPHGEEADGQPRGRGRPRKEPPKENVWPEPIDFLASDEATGAPELRPEHIPDALWPFVADTAARMGVEPFSVALSALVTCSSVMTDDWQLQPKQHDDTWTEAPRIWGTIVGNPSILKSPVISACTKPIDKLDIEARKKYENDLRRYRHELAAWKEAGKNPEAEPKMPRLITYMVENTTIEGLTEALRDDMDAKYTAPARKVLSRQDEMSEWLGNLDRYRQGGSGSGDRGAYLRIYNGGRASILRVARGSFAIPNWSACFLGGIQPDVIAKIAQSAHEDGLLQRFIYCVPGAQEQGLDRRPDYDAKKRYEELITALTALRPPQNQFGSPERAVVLHAEGQKVRESIDALGRIMTAMPDTAPQLKAALGKWPGLFARLCLIFHLIEAADARTRTGQTTPLQVVSAENARRVGRLMEEIVLPHLLRAYSLMFSTVLTKHSRWIAGHILAKGKDRITTRDIVANYKDLRAPEFHRDLHAAMEGLSAMGWVKAEETANPTAKPTTWWINPLVSERFAERATAEAERRRQTQDEVADLIRQRGNRSPI